MCSSHQTSCLLLELHGLLTAYDLFVFGFEVTCQLLCSPLDSLHAHLVVAVPLLEIPDAHEDRVLHLLLLFLNLFVQFWIEHFEGGCAVTLCCWFQVAPWLLLVKTETNLRGAATAHRGAVVGFLWIKEEKS